MLFIRKIYCLFSRNTIYTRSCYYIFWRFTNRDRTKQHKKCASILGSFTTVKLVIVNPALKLLASAFFCLLEYKNMLVAELFAICRWCWQRRNICANCTHILPMFQTKRKIPKFGWHNWPGCWHGLAGRLESSDRQNVFWGQVLSDFLEFSCKWSCSRHYYFAPVFMLLHYDLEL